MSRRAMYAALGLALGGFLYWLVDRGDWVATTGFAMPVGKDGAVLVYYEVDGRWRWRRCAMPPGSERDYHVRVWYRSDSPAEISFGEPRGGRFHSGRAVTVAIPVVLILALYARRRSPPRGEERIPDRPRPAP